ncbi:MAG: alpha/beta hydrolase [Betaproteobacteria bacterium]|nr:alpha/beta hydrolase [Betaproteobacteria bacterium]
MSALVLLPGMDGSGDLFEEFTAALRTIAPRLSMTIVRYPPDGALGYTELAAYAREQLPAGQTYAVLGESFSGPVAIMLAAARPPGLSGLILCCTFARNPVGGMRALAPLLRYLPLQRLPMALLRHYLMDAATGAGIAARLRTALSCLAPGVLAARMAAVLAVDASAELARLGVPVLYLRAARDRLIPHAVADRLARLQPRLRIADFPSPHLLLQTCPREAAARVLQFIDAGVPA